MIGGLGRFADSILRCLIDELTRLILSFVFSLQQPTMAPRLSLFTARSVAFRTKPLVTQKRLAPSLAQRRKASDDATKKSATTPVDPDFKGPNMDPLPHVSEEQAAIDKITGETPPDVDQGTPVQEVS